MAPGRAWPAALTKPVPLPIGVSMERRTRTLARLASVLVAALPVEVPAADPPAEDSPVVTAAEPPAGEEPAAGGAYAGQHPVLATEILWAGVRDAEARLAAAQEGHRQATGQLAAARRRHQELTDHLQLLGTDRHRAASGLADAEIQLKERAVAAFVSNDSAATAIVGSLEAASNGSALELTARRVLLDAAIDRDEVAIDAYLDRRAELERETSSTVDAVRALERAMGSLDRLATEAAAEVDRAADEVAAYRAGSAISSRGVVVPLAAGYSMPLVDSWGAPRMVGTPDEHWHEGIDLFAPAGTPLLAAERGVVTKVSSGRLGGLVVWLRGESGTEWYYAHLQRHEPGLAPGLAVGAGDVIGYVGNTGNAVTTPPHLHLEIHPAGGGPVDPYPLLAVIAERDARVP
jgi:murein DD-endopeptidase MepM/ murein hydrolase activator NlpD